LTYQCGKQLDEHKDKMDEATRAELEGAIAELKKRIPGEDKEAIEQGIEKLNKAMHGFSQKLYQDAQNASAQQSAGGAGGPGAGPGQEAKGDGKAVDADYEVVD